MEERDTTFDIRKTEAVDIIMQFGINITKEIKSLIENTKNDIQLDNTKRQIIKNYLDRVEEVEMIINKKQLKLQTL